MEFGLFSSIPSTALTNIGVAATSPESQLRFLASSEADLIQFHDSLGRSIRNEFELWSEPWTPELVNGIDYSPDHPDTISMKIIKEVWKREQK